MRTLVFLLLSCLGVFAQGGSYCTMSTWEPRNIATKAGLVASYDPGNTNTLVHNGAATAGSGISAMSNRITMGTADLVQATAGNQPRISRSDNVGNMFKKSEDFSSTIGWTRLAINAFGATDTGAAGAGSFANTARTTDPLGGGGADFIQQDGTSSSAHKMTAVNFASPVSSLTFSICAKKDAATRIMLYGDNWGNHGTGFDLQNGTTFTVTSITRPTSDSIVSLGSDWYLCSITDTSSSPSSTAAGIYIVSGTAFSFNGDNTSGVFLWGASIRPAAWQAVTGTDVAHGYIATDTLPIFAGLNGRQVLYFDGTSFRLKTAAFTLNQPTEIYLLCNHWSWTLSDCVFDGNALASGKLYESATTPKLRGNAGTDMTEFAPPTLGTWQVDNVIFSGANSRISTNSGAFVVSDANTGNMGGFTLGSAATAGTTYWNGLVARLLVCNKTNLIEEQQYIRWGLLKQTGLY